jgi:uncharacterized protein YndB with AHSA1/START domain
MTIESSGMSSLQLETAIDAGTAAVWSALTDNIGDWWPAEFYAGGEAGARSFMLEPTPGGRMLESWDGGGGVLWGTVVGIDPGTLLQVLGTVFPNWGGPSQWYGTWQLESSGDQTLLKFSESVVGRVTDAGTQEKDKGWRFLLAVMKAHIEGGPLPAWAD